MPDGLAALAKLGVTLDGVETGVFRGIRFMENGESVEACFPQGVGHGIRRILLHDRLHDRAAALGVQFCWATPILGIDMGADRGVVHAGARSIRCRWVVGADGINSRIRTWSGLQAGRRVSRRIGMREHYRIRPWGDFMEIYWSPVGQAYVTPVGTNELCVALVAQHPFGSVSAALCFFPELASRLHGIERGSSQRGALTTGQIYDRVTNGQAALVGDASGSVDAIVGDGLALSFLQADALGQALKRGDLSRYEREHRQLRRVPNFMSQSMLLLDRFGGIRRMTLSIFRQKPWMFERMLSIHVGATPLTLWGGMGLFHLGLQVLKHSTQRKTDRSA
jgi:flavin-dependent dehydrogenase